MKLANALSLFAATTLFLFFIRSKLKSQKSIISKRRAYYQGKVVWVTGASSGIGESIAYELYRCGAKVILSARRANELERVKTNCQSLSLYESSGSSSSGSSNNTSNDPFIVTIDLSDSSSIQNAAKTVLEKFSHVDILINNSGITSRGSALETLSSVEEHVMRINFFGTVELTKLVLPSMIEKNAGHVAVVSSVQGKLGIPFRSAYAASKHAIHGYFDSLRAEISKNNIAVTLCCPGYVKTNLSLNAVTASGSKYGVMDETTSNGYSPDFVAAKMLDGMVDKKTEIIIAKLDAVLAIYARCLIPGLLAKVLNKRALKQQPHQSQ